MNIESKGYKKLIESVKSNCLTGQNCFNANGCDKQQYRYEGGHCYKNIKCFHAYCNKFKWIIDRANHYAEKTGLTAEEILDAWEDRRNYWYMNYYQESNQPEIKGTNVKIFDTKKEFIDSLKGQGFRCPCCNGISSNCYNCDSGIKLQLINSKKKKETCNWSAGGLFSTMGKGVHVFIKETMDMAEIFMPIAWENTMEVEARCDVEGDDGIPSKTKVLGILPNEL